MFKVPHGSLIRRCSACSARVRSARSGEPREHNRRARYYVITAAGKRQLGDEIASWRRASAALNDILAQSKYRHVTSDRFVERFRALVHGARADRELDEELAFHIEQDVANRMPGAPILAMPGGPRRLPSEGVAQVKESVREARGISR